MPQKCCITGLHHSQRSKARAHMCTGLSTPLRQWEKEGVMLAVTILCWIQRKLSQSVCSSANYGCTVRRLRKLQAGLWCAGVVTKWFTTSLKWAFTYYGCTFGLCPFQVTHYFKTLVCLHWFLEEAPNLLHKGHNLSPGPLSMRAVFLHCARSSWGRFRKEEDNLAWTFYEIDNWSWCTNICCTEAFSVDMSYSTAVYHALIFVATFSGQQQGGRLALCCYDAVITLCFKWRKRAGSRLINPIRRRAAFWLQAPWRVWVAFFFLLCCSLYLRSNCSRLQPRDVKK